MVRAPMLSRGSGFESCEITTNTRPVRESARAELGTVTVNRNGAPCFAQDVPARRPPARSSVADRARTVMRARPRDMGGFDHSAPTLATQVTQGSQWVLVSTGARAPARSMSDDGAQS